MTSSEALAHYRLAWRAALRARSLPGLAYVASDLVGVLLEVGEQVAAETVTRQLLRRYDTAVSSRTPSGRWPRRVGVPGDRAGGPRAAGSDLAFLRDLLGTRDG